MKKQVKLKLIIGLTYSLFICLVFARYIDITGQQILEVQGRIQSSLYWIIPAVLIGVVVIFVILIAFVSLRKEQTQDKHVSQVLNLADQVN